MDTEYYVRHALFPQIIRAVYDDTCAVCGLFARIPKTSIVEAAHIKRFADFHDDHPSNGLALCKGHHWGFDAGAFGIANDYRIIVSRRIGESVPLVTAGILLGLPLKIEYAPAVEALRWHRQNVLLR